jgi:hypothetical protein
MSNIGKNSKRPIDKLRDGAGTFEIKTPDDESAITGMISLSENLFIIKEKGIYELKFADKIDPDRKNINTPNTIQQILPYGSDESWVGAVVLTGNDLLKGEVLEKHIDTELAMRLVIEIAQNIASAIELSEGVFSSQEIELNKYDLKIKPDRSFILPSMKGINSRCKEFLQKSDHALDSLFKVVKVFYQDVGKGGWEGFKNKVDKENPAIDNFSEVFCQMLPFLQFVRNARNCVEHPRKEQKVIVSDFSLDAANNLLPPLIEIIHPKSPQPPVPVADFMSQVTRSMIDIVELMLAFLCNRHIRPIKGFPVQVHEFPEDRRRTKNVKYGYGIATETSIIPFG